MAHITVEDPQLGPGFPSVDPDGDLRRESAVGQLRLLWSARGLLLRAIAIGACAGLLMAYLIPKRYNSTTRIMPPDMQSLSSMTTALARGGGALGATALDL